MACLFGGNRDIFFPKLDYNLNLIIFSEIAEKYLECRGYEPVQCATEDEARQRMRELKKRNKYPVYFFKSDTTGEKDFEEFYTGKEVLDMNRFEAIGVIKNEPVYDEEKQELCNILKEKKPDMIILGMGTPEQEDWALYLGEQGLSCPIITCGGFLTQTAKKTDYYRPLVKKLNLRWLQRAVEFKHIRRRLFIDYPKNAARYCVEHIALLLKKY